MALLNWNCPSVLALLLLACACLPTIRAQPSFAAPWPTQMAMDLYSLNNGSGLSNNSIGPSRISILRSPNEAYDFGLQRPTPVDRGHAFSCMLGVFDHHNLNFSTSPVWVATTATVMSCVVEFDHDGDLRLTGNSTNIVLFSSNTTGKGAAGLALTDAGNLLMLNATNGTIWINRGNLSSLPQCPSDVCSASHGSFGSAFALAVACAAALLLRLLY